MSLLLDSLCRLRLMQALHLQASFRLGCPRVYRLPSRLAFARPFRRHHSSRQAFLLHLDFLPRRMAWFLLQACHQPQHESRLLCRHLMAYQGHQEDLRRHRLPLQLLLHQLLNKELLLLLLSLLCLIQVLLRRTRRSRRRLCSSGQTRISHRCVLRMTVPCFVLLTGAVQEEKRAIHPKYYFPKETAPKQDGQASASAAPEESRGKKRARAEDFL